MAAIQSEIRFPPFPSGPPAGVTIIPFAKWTEIGILKHTDDGVERDALGIATVPILSAHDTDVSKTNSTQFDNVAAGSSKKGKKKNTAGVKVDWAQEWVLRENYVQPIGYNYNMFVTDRVRLAAQHFTGSRNWPKENETASSMSIQNQWDRFQVYVGIINSQLDHNQKNKDNVPADQDDDDDEGDDGLLGEDEEFTGDQDMEDDREAGPLRTDTDKGEKLWQFCDEPEQSVSVFLSSYMEKKGFIFNDRYLFSLPRIVRFFLKYLIVNRVMPEQEQKLNRALKIVDVAIEELPLTSKIPKALPDTLNSGFLNCFKIRPDISYSESHPVANLETPPVEMNMREVEAETESGTGTGTGTGTGPNVWGIETASSSASAWGSSNAWGGNSDNAWGGNSDNAWDGAIDTTWESNTQPVGSDDPWDTPAVAEWALSAPKSLWPLLGATALPLTHTSGIVEQSVRRIAQIIRPPTGILPKGALSAKPSPEAVEIDLEQRFTRVVLKPWDDPDVNTPCIHKLSKGAVLAEGEGGPVSSSGNLRPHNPWKDEITILVENETAAPMAQGLGLGASFIQIARMEDFEGVDTKKPKKSKRGETRFWYVSGVTQTLTSFHALAPSV